MKGNSYIPFMLRRGDGSTLSLDFTAMGGTLDSRFTFTRSSTTATYINSSGLVTSASTNVARFDYDPATLIARGLLIEASATNLQRYSEAFTSGTYWGYNATAATTESSDVNPTGSTGSISVAPSSNGGSRYLGAFATGLTTSSVYTFSIWLKAKGTAAAEFILFNSAGTISSRITIVSQPSGGTASVSNSPGIVPRISGLSSSGWTRIAVTTTATLGGTGVGNFFLYPSNTSGSTTADSIYIWGAQLEEGSFASSYIPTTTSTVQRTADTCIASNTGFSSWFTGGTSGTFYADWYGGVRGITSTVRTVLSTSDVTTQHLHLQQTAAAGNLKVADFGAANVVTTSNSITSGARTKGAFSFSGGTVNLTLNGGTVATSSSLAFSTAPSWLVLGGTSTDGSTITDGAVVLNGSIRAIKYWPSVLATATLQSLTT